MRLTIRAKLLIVIVTLSLALAAASVSGWIALSLHHDAMRTMYDDRVVPLAQLKIVSDRYGAHIIDIANKVRDGRLEWDQGIDDLDTALREAAVQWQAYLQTYLTPEETRLVDEAHGLLLGANASAARLRILFETRNLGALDAHLTGDLQQAVERLNAKIGELVELQLRVSSGIFADAERVFALSKQVQIFVIAAGLGAVLLGFWLILHRVYRPLTRMTEAMTRLAEGKLTGEIPSLDRSDEMGAMARAVKVFRETTEANRHLHQALRQTEEAIRELGESELAQRTELLRAALDTIPQAIAVIAPDRRVSYGNRSLGEMLSKEGVAPDSRGLSLEGLCVAAGFPADLRARVYDGDVEEAGTTATTLDGTPVRVRLMKVSTGDQLLAISDLTVQRGEEADRLAQRERILEAEKSQAVATLAGTIAHDFNNLLAVILGFSSLAAAQIKKDTGGGTDVSPGVTRAIDNVISSASRGKRIVDSLTAITRERRADTSIVDLRQIASDSEQMLRVLFPSSVRLEIGLADEPCRALVNPVQIEQIITNLCINAVHALGETPGRIVLTVDTFVVEGGRTSGLRLTEIGAKPNETHIEKLDDGTIAIFAGLLTPGRHIRLAVSDNGSGISEAVARKLFTPFFTTKEPGRGTGLGLASVMEIVTGLAGGIHVRSVLGEGTTFAVVLPETAVAPDSVAKAESVEAQAADDIADARTETRIMVVDDEDRLVELATAILQQLGYEVEGFTDPIAALDRFTGTPDAFDLLITDQTMPELTGQQLIERCRGVRRDLTAVICTGFSRDVPVGRDVEGVRSVLRKPYTPGDLAKIVREALAA